MKSKDKVSGKSQAIGSKVYDPKRNHFYALRSRGEQKSSPDVMNGMFQVFFIHLYALFDPGDTYFFTPLVARMFYIFLYL